MISDLVGGELDTRQFQPLFQPAYRLLLFSRWLDSDSDIVLGTYRQVPVDLTSRVTRATLTLVDEATASSLSVAVDLGGIPPDLFHNCVAVLSEGAVDVDPLDWPTTFTGWHQGQAQSSEAPTRDLRIPATSVGARGQPRSVDVTFTDRAALYRTRRVTTPGVWLPRGVVKNPDPDYQFRDDYDDVGSIVREIATSSWGMGLRAEECLIGLLGYRIEKQIQVVDEDVMTAVARLLEPLHLVPTFDGRGRLTTVEQLATKEIVRSYARGHVQALPAGQRDSRFVNAVRVVGLDSEVSEIVHADQRLLEVHGVFGFFDGELVFRGTWGEDETRSQRVKVGSVVDGDGVLRSSPRFVDFEQEGLIIEPVRPPRFRQLDEFSYEIVVENDVVLIAGLIASFLGGYVALAFLSTALGELDAQAGAQDTPNPAAIAVELLSAALLIGAVTVLQQIGAFRFEVWGVPFETVYREITAEASVVQFAAFDAVGGTAVRDYERVPEDTENHVFSSVDDHVTDDGTVNRGLRTWARERLAFRVGEAAARSLQVLRDLLLEPGDAIVVDDQVVYCKSIQRDLERGADDHMRVEGHQMRRV